MRPAGFAYASTSFAIARRPAYSLSTMMTLHLQLIVLMRFAFFRVYGSEPPHAPSIVFRNTLLCPRFQIFTPWKTSRRDICVQQYMHRSFFDEILDGGNPAGKDHNVRLVVSTRWDEMSHRIGVQFHCKVFHRKI